VHAVSTGLAEPDEELVPVALGIGLNFDN